MYNSDLRNGKLRKCDMGWAPRDSPGQLSHRVVRARQGMVCDRVGFRRALASSDAGWDCDLAAGHTIMQTHASPDAFLSTVVRRDFRLIFLLLLTFSFRFQSSLPLSLSLLSPFPITPPLPSLPSSDVVFVRFPHLPFYMFCFLPLTRPNTVCILSLV